MKIGNLAFVDFDIARVDSRITRDPRAADGDEEHDCHGDGDHAVEKWQDDARGS